MYIFILHGAEYNGAWRIAWKTGPNETKYWLGLLRDALKVSTTEMTNLLKEIDELSKIIAASLLTMKNKT